MAGYKNRAMGRPKTLPANSVSWNPNQINQGPGVGSGKGKIQSKAAVAKRSPLSKT
jgi:hypothetical protein